MEPEYMEPEYMEPEYMEPEYMETKFLKTYFIYTSHENHIMQIKETQLLYDDPETISKMRLIQKIQEMKRDELGKYILKNIALHHVVLNDNNIRAYVDDTITHDTFFKEITYLSDVKVHATHPCFHPISSLYVILQEKPHNHDAHNNTKKIRYNLAKTKRRKNQGLNRQSLTLKQKILKRKSLKQKF